LEQFLTADEVSSLFRIPKKTLYAQRHKGVGPPAIRIGKHLRYDQAALRRWLAEQGGQASSPALEPRVSAPISATRPRH
jgi:predicted DNA-binding transcriptional regulator AlpA